MVAIEHRVYASWLDWGTRAGLSVLAACFVAYVLALVEPFVPHHELALLWNMPVDDYIAATGAPTGWGWLRFLHKGDYLNFLGIAILALVTPVCYARIVPMLFKSGERLHGALAMLQVLVLLAAASGFLVGGH
jgi:hypothetical protein